MPSTDDVLPSRSLEELRAEVGRRAELVRRRDRRRVAVPLVAVAFVVLVGVSVLATTDPRTQVETVPPADPPATPTTLTPDSPSTLPGESAPPPGSSPAATPDDSRLRAGESPAVSPPNAPPPNARPPVASGAGGTILFSSDRGGDFDLWSVDARGGAPRLLLDGEGDDLRPSVSPDGSLLLFQRMTGTRLRPSSSRLFVGQADGTDVRELALPAGHHAQPAWGPDGRRIAYVASPPDGFESAVWVAGVDGSDARQVTGPGALWPAWSPDGRRLAYAAFDGERTTLMVLDLTSGFTRTLTSQQGYQPSWSPDGHLIAFRGIAGGRGNLFVVGADGHGLRQLTDADGWDSAPAWSPDGRWIVFDRDVDGHEAPSCFVGVRGSEPTSECLPGSDGPAPAALWVVATDGSAERQLTAAVATDHGASWVRPR